MKKIILGVVVVSAAVIGVFLALRSLEPSDPRLPPAPPPDTAPVAQKQDLATLMQSQTGPQTTAPGAAAPGAAPSNAQIDEGLPGDLAGMLRHADSIGDAPDPERSYQECLLDPRRAAKKYGVNTPPDVENPMAAEMASILCSRDVRGCDKFSLMAGAAGSDACPDPPCEKSVMLSAGEALDPSPEGCRQWASYLLFLAGALEGKDDLAQCKVMMSQGGSKWTEQLLPLCPQIAQDYRTGGAETCRILAQKSSAEMARTLCPTWVGFLKGEEACASQKYGASGRPSCELRARVREALVTKDPASCKRDPLCMAFLSTTGCSPENFGDTRSKAWNEVCRSAATAALMSWTNEASEKGQFAFDRLPNYLKEYQLIPEAKREVAIPRIQKAIARLEVTLAKAKILRDKMNKGQLTPDELKVGGPSSSPKSRAKSRKKKR